MKDVLKQARECGMVIYERGCFIETDESRLSAFRDSVLEEAAKAVPTSWLDSLLTGPDAVIGKPPYHCPDVEALLSGVAAAIRSMKGKP